MNAHLEQLAQRLQSDRFFLAAPLARYAKARQLNDDALAVELGCDRYTLTRLRLCRNPDVLPPHFWQDIECIVARFRLDPDRLAEILRLGQAFLQAQPPPGVVSRGCIESAFPSGVGAWRKRSITMKADPAGGKARVLWVEYYRTGTTILLVDGKETKVPFEFKDDFALLIEDVE